MTIFWDMGDFSYKVLHRPVLAVLPAAARAGYAWGEKPKIGHLNGCRHAIPLTFAPPHWSFAASGDASLLMDFRSLWFGQSIMAKDN